MRRLFPSYDHFWALSSAALPVLLFFPWQRKASRSESRQTAPARKLRTVRQWMKHRSSGLLFSFCLPIPLPVFPSRTPLFGGGISRFWCEVSDRETLRQALRVLPVSRLLRCCSVIWQALHCGLQKDLLPPARQYQSASSPALQTASSSRLRPVRVLRKPQALPLSPAGLAQRPQAQRALPSFLFQTAASSVFPGG